MSTKDQNVTVPEDVMALALEAATQWKRAGQIPSELRYFIARAIFKDRAPRLPSADRREEAETRCDNFVADWYRPARCLNCGARREAHPSPSTPAGTGDPCEHNWVDARNAHIERGEMCTKCHVMRWKIAKTYDVPDNFVAADWQRGVLVWETPKPETSAGTGEAGLSARLRKAADDIRKLENLLVNSAEFSVSETERADAAEASLAEALALAEKRGKALERLIYIGGVVHNLGAVKGAQWLQLGIALSCARACLSPSPAKTEGAE